MARTVAPFPPPPRPAEDACGELVRFYWCREYEARCIRPKRPRHIHGDGITDSRMCSVCGHEDQHAHHAETTGHPEVVLACASCSDGKCVLPEAAGS